jgi:hypothetical protein
MAEEFNFLEITHNPHFSQFVALLSVPYGSMRWRQKHPEIPFWTRVKTIFKFLHDGGLAHTNLRNQFIDEFSTLITELVESDPKLFYRVEDLDWFVEMLRGEYATVTMSMLFAMASCRQSYVTPVEAAVASGLAEITWRRRCERGDVIGALLKGKQWLIPTLTLQAYGYTVETPGQVIDEEEEQASER